MSSRTPILLSDPQEELVLEASKAGTFEEVPDKVRNAGRNYRDSMAVFGAPGIRALAYVIVDGTPWSLNSEFRDMATFRTEHARARVDVTPFGQPASVNWRPDAGETDASVHLDLHPWHHDRDGQYLATTDETDLPHIVVGWHKVPTEEDDA